MREGICGEGCRSFAAGGGVALEFVFEDEEDVLLGGFFCGFLEHIVDGGAVGRDVVEAPEIEAADLVGAELLGERDAAFEDFVLVMEADFGGAVHVVFGAVGGPGCAQEVDFVERAGDVGDVEVVLGEDLAGFGDLGVGGGLQVDVPEAAEFDSSGGRSRWR